MIRRLVVWGGKTGLESHRHVQQAFHDNARKLGIPTVIVDDYVGNENIVTPGDTVVSADIYGRYLPYTPDVDYVLHNFDGSHPLCRKLEETPERLLRLQVWTVEAQGEDFGPCRRFDRGSRTLFQPWGTDLLAEEFMPPVFNPASRDVVFVGAVWSEKYEGVELGNEQAVDELRRACGDHDLNFVHRTQIPYREMVELTRRARLAPTVVGRWQSDRGYLPCRAFKHASWGVPVFTNSPFVADVFRWARRDEPRNIPALVASALEFDEDEYFDLVHEDQEAARQFTYRESLQAIEEALEEIKR